MADRWQGQIQKTWKKEKIRVYQQREILPRFLAFGQIAQLDLKKIDTFMGRKIASAQEKA